MNSELTERGMLLFAEMEGPERAAAFREAMDSNNFGSGMINLAVDFIFGSLWTREGLDRKQRSLMTIGIMIGLRQPDEQKNHIRIGLVNGLSIKEIEEAIIHASAYAGFPAAWTARKMALEVIEEMNIKL